MRIRDWLTCLLLPLLIFSSSIKLVAEEDTKAKLRQLTKDLPIFGFCWHPSGQNILFNSRNWIYSIDVNSGRIKKLIYGRYPQWVEGGERFIYFLGVGYDGNRCELWSADPNGEARLRLSEDDFFISTMPTVSPDGNMLAFHYSCCMAAGGFEEIRLIVFKPSLDINMKRSVRILLVAPFGTDLHVIGWLDNGHLAVVRDGHVLVLDVNRVEWAPTDDSYEDLGMSMDERSKRFLRLKTSSVGVTETSYQELIQTEKIPYNCEISQDGQWLAQVKHEGGRPYKNKLIVRKLAGEEKSIMICEDVSPPRFYGLPRFAPADLKIAFIKWCGDPRYYYGDLWMADLSEIESKNSEYAGKDNGQEN